MPHKIEEGGTEEVKKLLSSKTPVVIFFYMDGCPHCDRTMGPWNELAKQDLPYRMVQIESAKVPPELGIHGFPHFMAVHKDGKKTKSDGEKQSKEEISGGLGLVKGGSRRRRTRRRHTRRMSRRARK
jgi:thiol-disulfide isomerase/thioredoxin